MPRWHLWSDTSLLPSAGDVKVRNPLFFSLFSPLLLFSVMLLFTESVLFQKLWSAVWQDSGLQRGFFWTPQGLQRKYLGQIVGLGQPEELSKLPLHLEISFFSKTFLTKVHIYVYIPLSVTGNELSFFRTRGPLWKNYLLWLLWLILFINTVKRACCIMREVEIILLLLSLIYTLHIQAGSN